MTGREELRKEGRGLRVCACVCVGGGCIIKHILFLFLPLHPTTKLSVYFVCSGSIYVRTLPLYGSRHTVSQSPRSLMAAIMNTERSALELISEPLTLPCGLTLPNRLVKCPMQETMAEAPFFDPPTEQFRRLYGKWGHARYGLLITGQVQIDIRFLSVAGDVVIHKDSLKPEHLDRWREWADVSQSGGTPVIVQLAHPGRMSPAGAGDRPANMQPLCPSSVPVRLGDSWLDKLV